MIRSWPQDAICAALWNKDDATVHANALNQYTAIDRPQIFGVTGRRLNGTAAIIVNNHSGRHSIQPSGDTCPLE